MFKKSKKLNPAPKAITVEQVLSDLETFAVPKGEIEPVRVVSRNDPDFDSQWWRLFETFMDDVDRLKRLQQTLTETKDGLTERRSEISKLIVKLEKEMGTQKKLVESIPPHL